MRRERKTVLAITLWAIVLITISYLVQTNTEAFSKYLDQGIISLVVYVFLMFIITFFAPISGIPLFPLATEIWGLWTTVLMSLVGKITGAMMAFKFSRIYGLRAVKKFLSLKKIKSYQRKLPRENLFWSLLFFRIAIPLDIMNYIFGIFSTIRTYKFFIITTISSLTYIITISYFGSLNWTIQLAVLVIGLIVGTSIWIFSGQRNN